MFNRSIRLAVRVRSRNELADVVTASVEIAHHSRTHILEFRQCIQQHCLYSGYLTVGVCQISFVFIVGYGPDSSEYELGVMVAGYVDRQSVVADHIYPGVILKHFLDSLNPLLSRLKTAFVVVYSYCDNYFVKQQKAAFDDGLVADGKWVKSSRIYVSSAGTTFRSNSNVSSISLVFSISWLMGLIPVSKRASVR